MNKKLADFLYVILIISVIAFMIFLVIYLRSSGKECLANPLEYYGEKTAQTCYCYKSLIP